jgi:hypothetical protein
MRKPRFVSLLIAVSLLAITAVAQTKIASPKEQLGFSFGDDYQLANYTQLVEYWKKLAQQSDRMKLVEIGKTAEGRPMVMAIITSPEKPQETGSLQRNIQASRYRRRAHRRTSAKPCC